MVMRTVKQTDKKQFMEEFNNIKYPFLDMGEDIGFLGIAIDTEKDIMFAGGIGNSGVHREYEIDIDYDFSVDANLDALYDEITEQSNI